MCEACSTESNQAPQGMAYTPGKPFPTHHAQNASDYLNAALSAERWIATFEHKTPEGILHGLHPRKTVPNTSRAKRK